MTKSLVRTFLLTLQALFQPALGFAFTNASPLVPAASPDQGSYVAQAPNSIAQYHVPAASGAIPIGAGGLPGASGTVFIGTGGALALTLAAPVAGQPSSGGHDGQEITLVAITAQAHTVTTPANKINGNKLTVTFAAIGDTAVLQAYQGIWYCVALKGAVLS